MPPGMMARIMTMNFDTLRELLRRRPFQPLTIRFSGGREHTIKKADLYMFAENGRVIWLTEGDRIFRVEVAMVEGAAVTPALDQA